MSDGIVASSDRAPRSRARTSRRPSRARRRRSTGAITIRPGQPLGVAAVERRQARRARSSPARSRPAGGCCRRARPSSDRASTGSHEPAACAWGRPPRRRSRACELGAVGKRDADRARVLRADRDDLGPGADLHAERRRGRRRAPSASAPVPPIANTAVPGRAAVVARRVVQEHLRACPVAHGPIAVYSTPRVASGPRTASSSKTSCDEVGDRHGQRPDRPRGPVFAPRSRNALAELQSHDRVGERRATSGRAASPTCR